MLPPHRALLVAAALWSAPLTIAEPALGAAPPSAASSAPTLSTAPGEATSAPRIPHGDLEVPTTPMPLSLPDPARAEEMEGEYAVGILTLTAAAAVAYAAILALVYFTMRRSWAGAR